MIIVIIIVYTIVIGMVKVSFHFIRDSIFSLSCVLHVYVSKITLLLFVRTYIIMYVQLYV